MEHTVINFQQKLGLLAEHWQPKVIAQVNDQHLKLVKIQGQFVWHSHAETDEVFIVLEGSMEMAFRERRQRLRRGEMCVVPRGVEHRPEAEAECCVLLIEAAGTLNTGDTGGEMTAPADAWI